MSGLEVIGAFASVVQVVDAGLKLNAAIRELYGRVKDSPDRVILHTTQVNQLINTARSIEQTTALQTPTAHAHLLATLTQALQLQQILEKLIKDYTQGSSRRKFWKAIVGSDESRLAAGFDQLEKEKAALNICISFASVNKLDKISCGVDKLVNRSSYAVSIKTDRVRGECATMGKEIRQAPDSGFGSETDEAESSTKTTKPNHEQNEDSSTMSTTSNKERFVEVEEECQDYEDVTSRGQATQLNGDAGVGCKTYHHYTRVASTDQSFQHNGNVDDGGSHTYKHVEAMGSSQQHNGNVGEKYSERIRSQVLDKRPVRPVRKRMVTKKMVTKKMDPKHT